MVRPGGRVVVGELTRWSAWALQCRLAARRHGVAVDCAGSSEFTAGDWRDRSQGRQARDACRSARQSLAVSDPTLGRRCAYLLPIIVLCISMRLVMRRWCSGMKAWSSCALISGMRVRS